MAQQAELVARCPPGPTRRCCRRRGSRGGTARPARGYRARRPSRPRDARARRPARLGELAVRDRLAVRDPLQLAQAALLERRHAGPRQRRRRGRRRRTSTRSPAKYATQPVDELLLRPRSRRPRRRPVDVVARHLVVRPARRRGRPPRPSPSRAPRRRRTRSARHDGAGAARLVQEGVDLARGLARQAGHGLELVGGRREHAGGRAEVLEQRLLAGRPDARAAARTASRCRSPSRRRRRWCLSANRCASSRIRRSRSSAGESSASTIGSARPGTNTSSIRFARPIAATRGRSRPSSAPSAADSWPLAAVDHDEVRHRREAGVVAVVGRRPRSRAG